MTLEAGSRQLAATSGHCPAEYYRMKRLAQRTLAKGFPALTFSECQVPGELDRNRKLRPWLLAVMLMDELKAWWHCGAMTGIVGRSLAKQCRKWERELRRAGVQ